ncbi:hypothetical protein HP550_01275 [Cellulomonas humilata]|uniref:Flagellar hook-length control protein-like C-terminal domain-containing protein n=1 Tax=Cellulomonas humilata TaxID=144055 RepID=A0A7Y5ZXC4_9CELL|nr:hypothetical protein [Cellulomonas humilata]
MTAALTALPPATPRPARVGATAPQSDFAQVLEQASARAETLTRSTDRADATAPGTDSSSTSTSTEAGAGGAAAAAETPATDAAAPTVATTTDPAAAALTALLAAQTVAAAPADPAVTTTPAPPAAVTGTPPAAEQPEQTGPSTTLPVPAPAPAPTTTQPAVPAAAADPAATGTDRPAAGIDRPAPTAAHVPAPVTDDQVALTPTPAGTAAPVLVADPTVAASPTPTPAVTGVVAPVATPVTPTIPTAPALPTPTAQPAPPPLAEQLGARLTALTGPGGLSHGRHILTVPVDPENLGPVRIVAHIGPESVRVELVGATEASREALRGALSELRRDLAASGLTVDVGPDGGRPDGHEPDPRGAVPWQQPRVPTTDPGTPAPAAPDRPPSRGLDLLA